MNRRGLVIPIDPDRERFLVPRDAVARPHRRQKDHPRIPRIGVKETNIAPGGGRAARHDRHVQRARNSRERHRLKVGIGGGEHLLTVGADARMHVGRLREDRGEVLVVHDNGEGILARCHAICDRYGRRVVAGVGVAGRQVDVPCGVTRRCDGRERGAFDQGEAHGVALRIGGDQGLVRGSAFAHFHVPRVIERGEDRDAE